LKLVDRSLTTISEGSAKIEGAIEQAATEIAAEIAALPGKVNASLTELAQQFQAIAKQLAEIPGLINPLPIVAPLPEQMGNACSQIQQICTEAGQIPQALLAPASQLPAVSSQVMQAVDGIQALPAQWMQALPDVPAQLQPLSGLAGMAQAIMEKALSAQAIAQPVIDQTLPKSAELKSIELALNKLTQSGVASPAITGPLQQQAQGLKAEIQGQFDGLRQQLDGLKADLSSEVSAMHQVVSNVETALVGVLSQAKANIQSAVDQGLAPLQTAQSLAQEVQAAVQAEADHCALLFDQAQATMNGLMDQVRAIMEKVRGQLDAMEDHFSQTGLATQALIDQSAQPVEQIKVSADACMDAVEKAVAVIGEQIDAVQLNLDDVSAQAEQAKTQLRDVPHEFDPVRDCIAQASDEIDRIKAQIPGFVGQAMGALGTCRSELDQAGALCDNAIDICTKHMASAPPLAIARGLFQGVKANIPPLQSSIQTAMDLVDSCGTSATALMVQAQSVVLALDPVLDQVLEKLQPVLDALVDLLTQLQQGIEAAKSALDNLMDEVKQHVAAMRSQCDALLKQVQDQAQAFLEKIQLQATIDGALEKLDAMSEPIFSAMDEQLNASSGRIATWVKQAQSKLADSASALQAEVQKLLDVLDQAQALGLNQVSALDARFDHIQSSWTDIKNNTQTGIEKTVREMDEAISQALSDAARQLGIEWPAPT
jgi:phage-related protein